MQKQYKFAVVLSGCGRADGSEIHEATCALLAISNAGCSYQCFAPDIEQAAVVNHLTGKRTGEKRNVLIKSARIARGNIKKLTEFNPQDYNAVIFIGGVGAITNWCDFAVKADECTIEPSVYNAVINSFKLGTIIGAMCIAPVLIAKVLGGEGVCVTIGNDSEVASLIAAMGAKHQNCTVAEACVDEKCKVVTTPAYMLASSISEVAQGAQNMVNEILKLVK